MGIYRGLAPLKAYKGDMQPVNVYRGSTKVAGWHSASYSGVSPLAVNCDYNVAPDALTIDGKCVQTGTPSPSAPAPISTITGNVGIAGKGSRNLFDKSAATSGYRLSNKGLLLSNANSNVSASIPVVGGGTYTWSGTATTDSGGVTMNVCEYDISNTFVNYWVTFSARTLTLDANAAYVRISIPNGNVSTLQFESGSRATAYQAFAGYSLVTAALGENACASLPDGTHDSYDAVTGVLTKRVGKVVFDGTNASYLFDNSVVSTQVGVYHRVYWDTRILSAVIERQSCYVDRFTWHGTSWNADVECWDIEDDRLRLKILVSRLSADTFEAFKTWLAANPVTVYYALATPTTVQLTPHLPVVRTGIKTLSVGADVVPTLSATVKSMD